MDKNDGPSGATYYMGDNKEGQELIRQAENYAKAHLINIILKINTWKRFPFP